MALAAQHLSRTTSYDAIEAHRYHERSINFLIPLLNDDSAVNDDNMLAATVLLRFFEQMTCNNSTLFRYILLQANQLAQALRDPMTKNNISQVALPSSMLNVTAPGLEASGKPRSGSSSAKICTWRFITSGH
jgi:hypothetical protein